MGKKLLSGVAKTYARQVEENNLVRINKKHHAFQIMKEVRTDAYPIGLDRQDGFWVIGQCPLESDDSDSESV